MRRLFIFATILAATMLVAFFQQPFQKAAGASEDPPKIYLPLIANQTNQSQPIVVNHLSTNVHEIPDYWITQARKYVVHYAHTSHGSQILTGLEWLEAQDSKYNVSIRVSGVTALPSDPTALGIYDGNNYPGNTYITPEMYWESASGLSHTRSVLNSGFFDFSLWTWCGQMSSYSISQVQAYMSTLNQLEEEYSGVSTIYYTGHTDGTAPGSTLWRNNNLVRAYVDQNDKVLFDFADIESYDPAGTYYPNANDSCSWCTSWCSNHPAAFECQNLSQMGDCAHSNKLQCSLKAQAFWHLMARLAGWDGK